MPSEGSAAPRAALRRWPGLPLQILLALVAGALIGWLWPAAGTALQPVGQAFVAAVKMVVIPLVFSAVTLGTYRMGLDSPRLGRVALVTFGWFYRVLAAMFRMTGWVVALAPAAVLAVIAWLTATQGAGTLWALARLVSVMYLGYALFALLVLGGIALLQPRPLRFAREMLAPAMLAFVTRSSEVALPLHMEKLEEQGVENRTVSVVLPLGYSFNLDGSALYIGLATTFICEAYGLELSLGRLLTILGAALLASKGVANVPAGSLVALSSVLLALGLPADALALVAGVDVFLDMGRSGLNVFGNTLGVLIVRRFGEGQANPAVAST